MLRFLHLGIETAMPNKRVESDAVIRRDVSCFLGAGAAHAQR